MPKRALHTLNLPLATLAALVKAGYETVEDINASTPEAIARDARMSLVSSQAVFSATQTQRARPLTQSAAAIAKDTSQRYPTLCRPIDEILGGGIKRGTLLEISGPPGTPKESIAVNIAKSFVEAEHEVLFVDMQNVMSATQIDNILSKSRSLSLEFRSLILHHSLSTLTEWIVFLQNLLSMLEEHPKLGLLVLNSLWFPFQLRSGMSYGTRTALLERTKQTLLKACATTGLSVVITTQLSTKLLDASGSTANFDTGVRAVMVPQPGSTYLPSGSRSNRIMIVPRTRTTGVIRLLSSPASTPMSYPTVSREVSYEMSQGEMNLVEDRGPQ